MDAPKEASKVRGEDFHPAAAKPPRVAALVNDFAVQGEIETVALDLLGDAQADGDVYDL